VPLVTVLATAWGPASGGINTFNVDLCLALGRRIGDAVTIACVVPFATLEQIDAARAQYVQLIRLAELAPAADSFEESRADEVIRVVKEQLKTDSQWWIGHDVHSGPVALRCRDICQEADVR